MRDRPYRCLLPAIWLAASAAFGSASAANVVGDHILHNFDGPSGRSPEWENLLATFNASGKLKALYGVAEAGGAADLGVVFKITPGGDFAVLHSFGVTQDDGVIPDGNLIMDDAGNLYGTTRAGLQSPGIVYKLAPDGTETVLHYFAGPPDDGRSPISGVVMDDEHNLYGATLFGGRNDQGTIYKIAPDGTYKLLYMFNAGGRYPAAGPLGIVLDGHGGFYGIALGGRMALGVVFRLTGDVLDILHAFTGGDDGEYPGQGPLLDADGNIYGTTELGGAYGHGVVFRVTTTGEFRTLHSFQGGSDGADPTCQLAEDGNGVLYGTTRFGGGLANAGTVFSLTPSGDETILHVFRPRLGDGKDPIGGVTIDNDGKIYGTTNGGGANSEGTIFRVSLH